MENDLDIAEDENLLFEDTLSPGDVFERNFSDMNPRDERNDESHQTEQQATTSVQNNETIDVARFSQVPNEEIQKLKSLTVNKNTTRSTQLWMNVLKRLARRIENVNIETMATQELDKLLSKFYAEVKKQDGTDYEPDSLRIMQSAIECYQQKKKDIQLVLHG